MDQVITDGIQHLQLTKEEEEEISISTIRSDLLDECTLSLFGRLLADRQQNMRAFKSTIRSAWKMGSDLRIVDVGKNVFQFKFRSSYQMEWVERNGPWNFDNNLLLLCRWRKGLSVDNISFTHSPFWIQIWGLPFESMTEEVGKELGNKLGKYIESDRRSWSEEQAIFMRIRVDVPIDKPLRRGGNIVNPEGEKYWVTFKYERLPNFCFICGVLGHDEKHCSEYQGKSECHRQYGDWIRANSGFKGVFEKQKAASRGGSEERMEEDSGIQHSPMNASPARPSAEQKKHSTALSNHSSSNTTNQGQGSKSVVLSVENHRNDDQVRPSSPTPSSEVHSRVSKKSSVTEKGVEAKASDMGLQMHPSDAQNPSSSKPTRKPHPKNEPTNTLLSPMRGNLKRVARAQGKKPQNCNTQVLNLTGLSGSKRLAMHASSDGSVENPQKKLRVSHQPDALNHLDFVEHVIIEDGGV